MTRGEAAALEAALPVYFVEPIPAPGPASENPIWPAYRSILDDIHLTRFGVGRTGSVLAAEVARRFGRSLHGGRAPGEVAAAITATRRTWP